ncbi:MAG TPA: disulfide bond formation protein B [Vicinamibacterales bacterium]|nr:disulfide bond formation protein B [Vicinamibacterales bacterium]
MSDRPPASAIDTVLALAVLFLSAVPVGIAAFVLGFFGGESPCILCWQQRIGMALIALIGLFVLRYGAKPRYLGLAVLVGVWGIYMAVRHSALHVARDIGQGFSLEMLGAHTYTWSFVIFWCSTAAIGALIMLARDADLAPGPPRPLRRIDSVAFVVFLVVIAANIVQAFASTGPPPFIGQADPVRFSFNPRHWIWSLDEYAPAPISFRGRWGIDKPDVAAVDPDPGSGPLQGLPQLRVVERRPLALPLRGAPTGLAYDQTSGRFLLTTEHGVYVTDGSLSRVLRHTVIDPAFSVDIARFAAAAFVDSRTVIAVSENKSYVILREPEGSADVDRNYRYFLESFDQFTEVSRSRFATVRARMMYIMSAAYDAASNSMYTLAVPNAKVKGLVVSRFSMTDRLLSEEFVPALAPELAAMARAGSGERPLDAYYVTGAAIAGDRLYALSAAHSTLLAIDLRARTIVAAQAIPGLSRPTGMALKEDQLFIVGADGQLTIVQYE